MNNNRHNRTRTITSRYSAPALILMASFILAGCGGGVGGSDASVSGNSSFAGSNSVTLAWDPPPPNASVAGYRIYYGAAPGAYEQAYGEGINVGNVNRYTLLGLSGGTRYYFTVTAFDSLGNESTYSNEAQRDIP